MATYKVIQNIEAEDKFLGPLTLKQFIYAAICIVCIYIGIYALLKGVVWIIVVLSFPAFITGFLAFPWGRDQSTETWLLAKIRFQVKPRVRIWDQNGPDDLVTITAPKKVDKHLTKDFTQTEVKSRLKALAETIDSRGWAIKNVDMMPDSNRFSDDASDRLIQPSAIPQEVPTVDVEATEDILDSNKSPLAQKLNNLINVSAETHHQEAIASINQARQQTTDGGQNTSADPWFAKNPDLTDLPDPALAAMGVAQPAPKTAAQAPLTAEEQALLQKIHEEEARLKSYDTSVLPTIKTHDQRENAETGPAQPTTSPAPPTPADQTTVSQPPSQTKAQAAMTDEEQSDKLRLARNNDRSVESIAREVNKGQVIQNSDGEVIISLH